MKKLLAFFIAVMLFPFLKAQTVLNAGDIAVIAFNGDNPDAVFWVNLIDLSAGTQIKFTDNGWNGVALSSSEGTQTWTAPAFIPRGTVHALAISAISIGTTGDQIFAYQGPATAPVFIFGLSTNNWVTGTISQATSRKPVSLTPGINCIAFSSERDNGYLSQSLISGNKTTVLNTVCNSLNWIRSDSRFNSFPTWNFIINNLAAEPESNPGNLVFSGVKSFEYSLAFSASNPTPAGYICLRGKDAAPNTDPTDGITYTAGSNIGNAQVVFAGTSFSFTDRSVIANTSYYYKIYAYNGADSTINYRQANPLSGIIQSSASMAGSYYSSVSASSPDFVSQLKSRIRSPYTKVSYDQYDETMVMNFAFDYAPGGKKSVTCAYSGEIYSYTPPFTWYTSSPFSREHTWCVSWMPSGGSSSLNEYADQHHIYPVNQSKANAVRSNHPLGSVSTVLSSYLNGKYGFDALGNNVYEPRDLQKGDAARALFYMSLRYDGINGFNWTFNNLNKTILPGLNESGQDINTLLLWHNQDPPDNFEIARNDFIWSIQQNRNPFIDNPAWVNNINFQDLSLAANPAAKRNAEPGQGPLIEERTAEAQMVMFPNPASDMLNLGIDSPEETELTAEIYSVSGILVKKIFRKCPKGTTIWQENLSGFSAGIYHVMMHCGNQREIMRLIVE